LFVPIARIGPSVALSVVEALMDLNRILVAVNSLNSRDAAFERAHALAR
jgi:hypothetical protein